MFKFLPMKELSSIKEIDVYNKRIFLRVDFNVPLSKEGEVEDTTRIEAALPTLNYLLEQNASIVLASHLGRPKGKILPQYSLKPVAAVLSKLLNNKPVAFAPDCIGENTQKAKDALTPGEILLLENVRFHPEEEKNDSHFCEQLAKGIEVYINDAFGSVHRGHASTEGIAHIIPQKAAGLLVLKEVEYLGKRCENPERPFTVILGGAKVSDKLKVIDTLIDKADTLLIGGAMAYTFALAKEQKIGSSLAQPDQLDYVKACLLKAKQKGTKLLTPVDTVVTDMLNFEQKLAGKIHVVQGDIPGDWQGVDIGDETIEIFKKEIAKSKTILWNGPMGVFEVEACAKGTYAIAEAVAQSQALSIIGGGDSVKALKNSGFIDKVSFVSTGGGASIEYLEGTALPGLKVLQKP